MKREYYEIITKEVKILFPDLVTPRSFNPNETPKYGIVILAKEESLQEFRDAISKEANQFKFPLKSVTTLKSMDLYFKATVEALERKNVQGKLSDEDYKSKCEKLEEFRNDNKDYYITKAKTKKKPGVFDRYGNALSDDDLSKMQLNGAIARLILVPAYYEGFGGGVTLYLNAVQIIKQGPKGGMTTSELASKFGKYDGKIEDDSIDLTKLSDENKMEVVENDVELPF